MILENIENKGGDSRIIKIDKLVYILNAGDRIKVPDDFKYNNKHFIKVLKMPSRTYSIEVRKGIKVRGSLIKPLSKK